MSLLSFVLFAMESIQHTQNKVGSQLKIIFTFKDHTYVTKRVWDLVT